MHRCPDEDGMIAHDKEQEWPPLPLDAWEPTYRTIHRFTQVVGKVQLALAPHANHWWHVTLRVTPRGLTTGVLCGEQHLAMTFDFVDHRLIAETRDEGSQSFELEPMTVADFYDRVLGMLDVLEIDVRMWPVPVEVKDRTPFPLDRHNSAYDRAAVERFHRALLSIDRVFNIHRGRFLGKCSPVQFFWGAFDLAVTRFSGRRNPDPPPDTINHEAYSHEVISHGFWPGGDFLDKGRIEEAMFYAYAVPQPQGFARAHVEPALAKYSELLGEFALPYDAVRNARDPEATLLTFMESTYLAAARAAGWNVEELADETFAAAE
jgi:hypothetical protein